ncbi:MAG: type II toxin-antitoxin system HicB family antitoxin [Synechocystis sp.]|nr:type II toxin-antitoxin system HicB family antitoxin [Synechocystis sp.]
MDQYLIVLEKSKSGFSAYSPDVPGCIATGESLEDAKWQMQSALTFHLAAVDPLPQPKGIDAYLEALQDSAGEEFFLTHIALDHVLLNL